jgi:hypothetical protein
MRRLVGILQSHTVERVWLLAITALALFAIRANQHEAHRARQQAVTNHAQIAFNRQQISLEQDAYCKLKLYDLVTGAAGSMLFRHLGVLESGSPQAEAVAHALRLVASIPSGKRCVPNVRSTAQHDGIHLSRAAERLLLGSLTATATHPSPIPERLAGSPRAALPAPSTPPAPAGSQTPSSPTPAAPSPPPVTPPASEPHEPAITLPLPKPPCVKLPGVSIC